MEIYCLFTLLIEVIEPHTTDRSLPGIVQLSYTAPAPPRNLHPSYTHTPSPLRPLSPLRDTQLAHCGRGHMHKHVAKSVTFLVGPLFCGYK